MLKYRDIEAILQCEKRFYLEMNTPKLNTLEKVNFSGDAFSVYKWKSLKGVMKLVFDAFIPIKGKPRIFKMQVIAATEPSDEHIERAALP